MCGITGYIGRERELSSILLVGLERLSYRGYDSSGIATISDDELCYWKQAGKIKELTQVLAGLSINGRIGIGHTRWATHGLANKINAHPQIDEKGKIAVVHNGIIENHLLLKAKLLAKKTIFLSETDTEVIPHLIRSYLEESENIEEAFVKTLEDLEGSYSIVMISEQEPDKILVAKKGSPLIIGVGKNEHFISSDINSLISHTKDFIYLEDKEIGIIKANEVIIKDFKQRIISKKVKSIVNLEVEVADKGSYEHYMLKEIFEQPSTIRNILNHYVNSSKEVEFKVLKNKVLDFKNTSRFLIQGCGTSWHAGLVAKYWIENYARILTEVDISSELRYRRMLAHGNDIVLALSQSGETADTLACIREAKSHFLKVMSFVNVQESSMDKESDVVIYTKTGIEIGVASTKNYLAQLTCLYLFTIHLSFVRGFISQIEVEKMTNELFLLPKYIEDILEQANKIKKIAERYMLSKEFLFIGRGVNYPTALEGALKLKEISYIHATGYPAGELKHGPIALINAALPIVCITPNTNTYKKMFSNIQEVKARKGKIISIATEGNEEIAKESEETIFIPKISEELTPLLAAVPLQLLAYYIAVELDCNVDQPKNLAKSVTVE